MSQDKLAQRLAAWRTQQLQRVRRTIQVRKGVYAYCRERAYLCFASNDYLGLSQHAHVVQAAQQALQRFGVGSGSAAMIAGYSQAHADLEAACAQFFGYPRAVLFSTGFMANQALLTTLLDRHAGLCADKLCHASVWQAARCSGAHLQRFQHNQVDSAARGLQRLDPRQTRVLMTEGVFSMDGDRAPLAQLQACATQQQAYCIVDDAHAVGVLGEQGRGSTADLRDKPIMMATFGKALGGFGAFVCGDDTLCEALLQFAPAYTYTTAFPPAVAAANQKALEILQQEPEWQAKLQANIQYFRKVASELHLPVLPSHSAIQILPLNDVTTTLQVGNWLLQQGFWVGVIRPPTVAQARLRICLSALHTREHIEQLLGMLQHALSTVSDEVQHAI